MQRAPATVTLIGAGLNGPLLATSLVERGFRVEIYERRPDMRRVSVSAGRSINLALSTRGIHALAGAGLWDVMRNLIIPMKGRMMHSLSGELTFQPYGKDETEVINSISRADLNAALMNEAEKRGVKIDFNERCIGFDLETGAARFRNEETRRESDISGIIMGADGASSAIRHAMLKLSRFNVSQQLLDYGYKELTITAGPDAKHVLEPNALHIWPRRSHMLIVLPNIDGTFACILFLPVEGKISFASLDSETKFLEFFEANFPDAVPLMPNLGDNFRNNLTGSMVNIKFSPWHVHVKSLLIGDAAHAIVPF